MATEIILPEMGEGVIEGTLSRWLVSEGDRVDQYAAIAEVETDKVTTETTTEIAGTILQLCISEGETVPVGTILAYIGRPGEKVSGNGETKAVESDNNTPQERESVPDTPPIPVTIDSATRKQVPYRGRVSPVVGRIAGEHHIDLQEMIGTGRDGRITKKDILAFIDQQATDLPVDAGTVDAPPPHRAVEDLPVTEPAATTAQIIPLTGMRRIIADHMVLSKRTSPHVTTVFEYDFSAAARHRNKNKEQFARDGVRLTYMAYIVAATVFALKKHPLVNSSLTDAGIELKPTINVGMATALDEGLIVPVIKQADGLNLLGLGRKINDLADRARSKKLLPEEVQGGTFSITNHGTSGSLFATPIINQPQCGILGVGKIEKRVIVIDDAIAIRPLAYVSFTFDHRILDGAAADAFVATIKEQIENWPED